MNVIRFSNNGLISYLIESKEKLSKEIELSQSDVDSLLSSQGVQATSDIVIFSPDYGFGFNVSKEAMDIMETQGLTLSEIFKKLNDELD